MPIATATTGVTTRLDMGELARVFRGETNADRWFADPTSSPYWITIDGHVVTQIEEQYVP